MWLFGLMCISTGVSLVVAAFYRITQFMQVVTLCKNYPPIVWNMYSAFSISFLILVNYEFNFYPFDLELVVFLPRFLAYWDYRSPFLFLPIPSCSFPLSFSLLPSIHPSLHPSLPPSLFICYRLIKFIELFNKLSFALLVFFGFVIVPYTDTSYLYYFLPSVCFEIILCLFL